MSNTPLTKAELATVRELVGRIRRGVRADLVEASLFGSKARGTARPDSDVDVLLVFRKLPWDREPFATQAEEIAEEVGNETGIPVTVWSVSLIDFEAGNRTPMLVDAMEDAIRIWSLGRPLPRVRFGIEDALRCSDALQRRIGEGGDEFREHLTRGAPLEAARRARDDLVRASTAILLTHGITRPRRADAVRALLGLPATPLPRRLRRILKWAIACYDGTGADSNEVLRNPPCTPGELACWIDHLRHEIDIHANALGRDARGTSG